MTTIVLCRSGRRRWQEQPTLGSGHGETLCLPLCLCHSVSATLSLPLCLCLLLSYVCPYVSLCHSVSATLSLPLLLCAKPVYVYEFSTAVVVSLLVFSIRVISCGDSTLQHTTAHYSTLQHPTAHYSTLQHPTAPYITLQHPTAHYSTLQHPATHCTNSVSLSAMRLMGLCVGPF